MTGGDGGPAVLIELVCQITEGRDTSIDEGFLDHGVVGLEDLGFHELAVLLAHGVEVAIESDNVDPAIFVALALVLGVEIGFSDELALAGSGEGGDEG